jgi:sulfite exporter TauE/SafE
MGIMLGWGPCLYFCTPILIPYIAGTQKGWLSGLRASLIFSFSRVFAYLALAVIAASIGHILLRKQFESTVGSIVYLVVGIVIVILGIAIVIGKIPRLHLCSRFTSRITRNSIGGIALLGLLIGLSPCVPLFGVLAYIAVKSTNILQGLFYGACFGAGTLLTPLIPMGVLAGGVSSLIAKKPRIFDIVSRLCGCFLIYVGVRLLIGEGYL